MAETKTGKERLHVRCKNPECDNVLEAAPRMARMLDARHLCVVCETPYGPDPDIVEDRGPSQDEQ